MHRRQFLLAAAAAALAPMTSSAQPTENVVLVHGLWMTGAETGLLRSRLADDYAFDVRQYSYYTVSVGLDENVARLAEFLRTVPGETLHVVGHSLGGLLALHTLARHADLRPGRVVCLGSPLRGSSAARAMAGLPFGEQILGATIRDAVLNGGLSSWDGPREVGVIAGTLGMGLGVVIENLPTPNDGTVAVVETQLPGIKDHLELPVSHTGFLFAPAVVSQTAYFLRHGAFARPGTPAS
jgi:pimeloyl-ACP methyl ester carboxylesterase